MAYTAHLKPDSFLWEFFPNGEVPIESVFPITPKNKKAPPCLKIDTKRLTGDQIEGLALELYQTWKQDMDLDYARTYVKTGLPISMDNFCGYSTDHFGEAELLNNGLLQEVLELNSRNKM